MKNESLKKVLGLEKESMVSAFACSNQCLISIHHPRVFTINECSTENKGLENKRVKKIRHISL